MKILWLAPEPPITPLSGGRDRARQMLRYLAARHEVCLVSQCSHEELNRIIVLEDWIANFTALSYDERKHPVRRAKKVFRKFKPDVVHVQGLSMLRCVPVNYAGKRVLEFHDAPPISVLQRLEPELQQMDNIIVVSERDRDRVYPYSYENNLVILPNGVDLSYWIPLPYSPGATTLLFPAALNWKPNIDAAYVLVNELLPALQKRMAHIELVIAGRQPVPKLTALVEMTEGVRLIADPLDMRPCFEKAAAVIVPTSSTAGTRLKILQALAVGRPVISTPEGAAGLELTGGEHLVIAPLLKPFIEAIEQILQDNRYANHLIFNGLKIIESYQWHKLLSGLETVYPS